MSRTTRLPYNVKTASNKTSAEAARPVFCRIVTPALLDCSGVGGPDELLEPDVELEDEPDAEDEVGVEVPLALEDEIV